MNNDKISSSSHNENITSMLGEKVMNEMITLLFDYSGLVKRVEKLEKERAEHLDDTKQKQSERLTKISIWTAISVGVIQIGLLLYQIFGK